MSQEPYSVPAGGRSRLRPESIRAWPPYRTFLFALLLIFAAKQAFNVVVFPPFTGHDEVAHYAYLRTVATEHRVPVIPDLEEWRNAWAVRGELPGDTLPDDLYQYCRYVLDWNFCDEPQWRNNPPQAVTLSGETYPHGWQYAANHPPLFYVLLTPAYLATERFSPSTQQYIFRALTVPIGMLIIVLTYLIAGLIFPRDRFMLAVAPTFVAFQTQLSYESAMVNNDILLVGLFTLLIYLLVRGVMRRFSAGSAAVIGLVLGIGLLAKASMLAGAPLIAVAMILGVGIRNVRRWIPLGAITAVVAGMVAAPWYIFLYRTYGNLSGLDQVKALQFQWTYRFSDPPSMLDMLFDKGFALWRWRETWGEFGWRLIHLEGWLLTLIGIPLLIMALAALATMIRDLVTRSRTGEPLLDRRQTIAIWLLLLVALVAYGAMLQFGTTFQLTQARYFFNAMAAVAILLAFGYRALLPVRVRPVGVVAFLMFMVGINVLIYSQAVLPYWYLAS
ncbi:MAG: hypothetical protein M3Y37_04745 [Chloroflexota bacterium]|nr:hypothetical protein [Chloroflexota bacterium]